MSNPQRVPLEETLGQLEDALNRFQALLEEEASALSQHDNQVLIDLIQAKAQHADKVEQLVKQLKEQFGVNLGQAETRLVDSSLEQKTTHLQQRIQTCHELNQRNGLVIHTLLGTNTQLMNLLMSNLSPSLYNATGGRTKADPQTSTLAKA